MRQDEWLKVRAERDALRERVKELERVADVGARLKEAWDVREKSHHDELRNEAQRAERAEAEVATLRAALEWLENEDRALTVRGRYTDEARDLFRAALAGRAPDARAESSDRCDCGHSIEREHAFGACGSCSCINPEPMKPDARAELRAVAERVREACRAYVRSECGKEHAQAIDDLDLDALMEEP